MVTGSPTFGTPPPGTDCANTSFSPFVGLAATSNGFTATGTVTIQLSGPIGTGCTVSWSALVPVQLTPGSFTVDGTIDATLTLPANSAPLATFFTRTTLQGLAFVETKLLVGNGQHLAALTQTNFFAPVPASGLLTQEFTFTACPCPNGGTVAFHIPISAGVTEVPEPESATLVLLAATVLALLRKCRTWIAAA